jgi:hypothetical protein
VVYAAESLGINLEKRAGVQSLGLNDGVSSVVVVVEAHRVQKYTVEAPGW